MKCEKCGATDCKDLARQVQELTAELQEQCKLVGKDIDRCDKLVMEKRAVEVERDQLAAVVAVVRSNIDEYHAYEDALHGRCMSSELEEIRDVVSKFPKVVTYMRVDCEPGYGNARHAAGWIEVSVPAEYIGKDVLVTVQEVE